MSARVRAGERGGGTALLVRQGPLSARRNAVGYENEFGDRADLIGARLLAVLRTLRLVFTML